MSNELALTHVTPQTWEMMRDQAAVLVKTGFLPAAIKSPEQALAIMLKGRELGIPPMQALSSIAVIQGKPTAGAELMLALIYRDHGDEAVKFVDSTPTVCTIAYKRRGWQKSEQYSFTAEDAKRAGLSGQNWSKYPAAMLRARCISAVARMAFPDSIGGMYTPEELGASVHVDETGEVKLIEETRPDRPVATQGGAVFIGNATRNVKPETIEDEEGEVISTNLFGEEQELPPDPDEANRQVLRNLVHDIVRVGGLKQSAVEGRIAQKAGVGDIYQTEGEALARCVEQAEASLDAVKRMEAK